MRVENVEHTAPSPRWIKPIVFLCLFLTVFLLQNLSGAYRSEFGGYPDEPAHYVTSVMVRDFIASGRFGSPMEFAQEYYKAYPKVAFGHWPPLLYVVQGVWMLAFSESRSSVLVELALTTTIAAFLLFLVASNHFGIWSGILSSLLLVCLPIIQTYFDEEMAESLLLVTGFSAALFFCRYLETKRWKDSFWFGVFCSLAILTKGNGWALAMIPPIALCLTRDFSLLAKPSFWIPVPLVAVLCVPWQMATLEMANRGWVGGDKPSYSYTIDALGQFGIILCDSVGWAIAAFALLGIWLYVVRPLFKKAVQPFYAVMLGLLVCIWLFHSVVPAGVEPRKMIDALPAVILFALASGHWVVRWLNERQFFQFRPSWAPVGLASLVTVLFAAQTFAIPIEQHYGFTEASQYIQKRMDLRNAVILVSSERDGEGLFISELMMHDDRPEHTILRANKLLSRSDWNGNVAQDFCKTPDDVMSVLKTNSVRVVVLDTYPRRVRYRHNDLIWQAIQANPAEWKLASTFAGGKIQIYNVKSE